MDFPVAKMGFASAEVIFRDLPQLQIDADVIHLLELSMILVEILNVFPQVNALLEVKD